MLRRTLLLTTIFCSTLGSSRRLPTPPPPSNVVTKKTSHFHPFCAKFNFVGGGRGVVASLVISLEKSQLFWPPLNLHSGDTSIQGTLALVPRVAPEERFHCTPKTNEKQNYIIKYQKLPLSPKDLQILIYLFIIQEALAELVAWPPSPLFSCPCRLRVRWWMPTQHPPMNVDSFEIIQFIHWQ